MDVCGVGVCDGGAAGNTADGDGDAGAVDCGSDGVCFDFFPLYFDLFGGVDHCLLWQWSPVASIECYRGHTGTVDQKLFQNNRHILMQRFNFSELG